MSATLIVSGSSCSAGPKEMFDAELHRPERRIPRRIVGASQPCMRDEGMVSEGVFRGLPFWKRVGDYGPKR